MQNLRQKYDLNSAEDSLLLTRIKLMKIFANIYPADHTPSPIRISYSYGFLDMEKMMSMVLIEHTSFHMTERQIAAFHLGSTMIL